MSTWLRAWAASAAFVLPPTGAAAPPLLDLVATHSLAGVRGRIDHFAVDAAGHRIFVAALGNDTVEVLDTRGAAHRSLAGFGEPQGVAYLPDQRRLFIANGSADRVDVLDASFAVIRRIEGLADADNVRIAADGKTILAGYGKGALAIIDGASATVRAHIALPGHPESFQVEKGSSRVYVNVPAVHAVVVADLASRSVVATWPVPQAARNFPMALDEAAHRLFVGARSPAVMLVYDTHSGRVVARVPIGGDTDDLFFDAQRKRIYAICGEGRVDVVKQEDADRYTREASIDTAPGARTGLFVPEEGELYVAAPARGTRPARILVYRTR
jgi:DNA-binding beta-propeller fold protein YncE